MVSAAQHPKTSSGVGKMLAVAVLGALCWFTRSSGPKFPKTDEDSAAFADNETDPENFDQARSAGPNSMRSDARRTWDSVDQAADESFPAGAPPATY